AWSCVLGVGGVTTGGCGRRLSCTSYPPSGGAAGAGGASAAKLAAHSVAMNKTVRVMIDRFMNIPSFASLLRETARAGILSYNRVVRPDARHLAHDVEYRKRHALGYPGWDTADA